MRRRATGQLVGQNAPSRKENPRSSPLHLRFGEGLSIRPTRTSYIGRRSSDWHLGGRGYNNEVREFVPVQYEIRSRLLAVRDRDPTAAGGYRPRRESIENGAGVTPPGPRQVALRAEPQGVDLVELAVDQIEDRANGVQCRAQSLRLIPVTYECEKLKVDRERSLRRVLSNLVEPACLIGVRRARRPVTGGGVVVSARGAARRLATRPIGAPPGIGCPTRTRRLDAEELLEEGVDPIQERARPPPGTA